MTMTVIQARVNVGTKNVTGYGPKWLDSEDFWKLKPMGFC